MSASKDSGLVPLQRLANGLNSDILFPNESLRFSCGSASATHQRRIGGDPAPKTRELTGFIEDKMFGVDREPKYFQPLHVSEYHQRIMLGNASGSQNFSDGSEEDLDDDEDDEEVDEGCDGEVEVLVNLKSNNDNNNSSSNSVHSSAADKIRNDCAADTSFAVGSNRDGCVVPFGNNNTREISSDHHQQVRANPFQNAAPMAEPYGEMYYSQFIHRSESSGQGQKDLVLENGTSGNSLKMIMSDPLTGALMEDAMILPCGHSFGSGGMQHFLKMKACYTCSRPFSEDLAKPNLSLRAAVMAFRREEEMRSQRASKRRREQFEDKGFSGDSLLADGSRGRGVQFPFAVADRVVIKGNKRTPERFVGRVAIVTTQCLNGWYVVKTLDNAESVKLQYRSLAKVADTTSSSKQMSNKTTPNWL